MKTHRVRVHVNRLHIGILARDLEKDAMPKLMGLRHRVRLIGHVQAPSLRRPGVLEPRTHDPLDASTRIDVLCDRDLVVRPALELPSEMRVGALRVFAKHDEVNVRGLTVAKGYEP